MSNLSKYMQQIKAAFPAAVPSDVYGIGRQTLDKVSRFLTERNAIREGNFPEISVANESLAFDDAINATGVEELSSLVQSCGIKQAYVAPCCEAILTIMDRCLHRSAAAVWNEQNKKHSTQNNSNAQPSAPLSDIYASDTVAALTGEVAPSQEAFGVNIDLAVPDLKVAITVAIMNFHTRLLPRLLPVKSINQPEIQYTKEYLEVYDLADNEAPRKRMLDLYTDPEFAANELKRIIPLLRNDNPEAPEFLASWDVDGETSTADGIDGLLKFGVKANILKLSIDNTKYGYSRINKTDLIAENVKLDFVVVKINGEYLKINVPLSLNRLTRTINNDDVAQRNADIKFRVALRKGATKKATVATNDEFKTGAGDAEKTYQTHVVVDGKDDAAITASLGENDFISIDFNLKPSISLKYGDADCLGAIKARVVTGEGSTLTDEAKAALQALVESAELVGYSLDARFSEENLRKTSIAVWTHRQNFSYDIPIGRNYVFDYAIGQENADENATNLTKVIGIGQDHVALSTVLIRTAEDVADRIKAVGYEPADRADYVGTRYVAGDKVRPTVFSGTLDFNNINIIRDSDRPGDIKQKALTYLNAVTTNLLQDSLLLQQLEGNGVTFRCVTSMSVLGKVLAQPHIHNHMDKEDARDLGDGVEYVLVLPNGVRIEFVTTTFKYMRDRLFMFPIIKNNAESELNYAMNFDYGTLVAHYTPSGEEAHHRLFANIRELPIVTNPIAILIDIVGMDRVNELVDNNLYVRPTIDVRMIEGEEETQGTTPATPSEPTNP